MNVHDFFVAPIWLAANVVLVCGMWRLAGQLAADDSFVEKVRNTLVLCWACVVGTAIPLGLFGALSALSLLAGVSAVSLFGWWMFGRGSDRHRSHPKETCISDASAVIAASVSGDSGGQAHFSATTSSTEQTNARRTMSQTPACERLRDTHEDGLLRTSARASRLEAWCWFGWCVWAALCAGRLVVSGLLEYPSNWDTLTYHLPFVDAWLSTGNLYVPGLMKWFFPGNNELVALWMVAPFSGDFLAPLNNLPAIALLVLSVIELARMLGVRTLTRHLGVLALMSNYVVWHQLMDNKNDVAVVSLFFASLVYAFRYAKDTRTSDLLLVSICFGLLAGVKYYTIAYLGVSYFVLVLLTASSWTIRRAVIVASVCLVGILVWGSYWYVRNTWATGLPFYPKSVFVDGSFETGVNANLGSTTLWGNADPKRFSLWFAALWRMTGPCHMASLFLSPCAVLWLLVSGWKLRSTRPDNMQGKLRWTLATVTLASAAFYVVTPFTVETRAGTLGMIRTGYVTIRMGLCFLSLMVLCAIILVNDWIPLPRLFDAAVEKQGSSCQSGRSFQSALGGYLSYACLIVGVGVLGYQFLVEHRLKGPSFAIDRKLDDHTVATLAVAELLLGVGCLVFLSWHRHWLGRRTLIAVITANAVAITAIGGGLLGTRWHSGFAAYYDQFYHTQVFAFLEKHNPGRSPVCVLSERSYPFAGSRRQFPLLQAHSTPSQPRKFSSREMLLAFLHDRGAGFVAISRRPWGTLWNEYQLDAWSDEHPGVFTTIWEDRAFLVKKVNPGLLAAALGLVSSARLETVDRKPYAGDCRLYAVGEP